MHTLHGRRVRLGDLLDAGLLRDGEAISISVGDQRATAVVVRPGRIRLESGRVFHTPSPAASAAVGGGSLAGWNYWRTSDGRTLDALRQELLDQVASTSGDADDVDEPGTLSPAGSVWLKEVRDRALAGKPTTIPVRDLLAYWGLDRRDSVAVDHVVATLAERGLEASPSVLATSLDDSVVIRKPAPIDSERAESRAAQHPESGVAVGLVLSGFMDADRPLVSVQPQHTLRQARSLMRINGYSQLAILNGRTLRGAITWESMTDALFAGAHESSTVMRARVHAQSHPAEQHLLEVIGEIAATGFVIVMGQTGPAGIVTYSDIADSFVDLATPFALIGDIDRRLRRALDKALDWDFLSGILVRDDARTPENVDQLGFADYLTAFASAEVWDQLGWWMDRAIFVARLDELRAVRNKVTHFNPDPPSPADVEKLRLFNDLVIELTST